MEINPVAEYHCCIDGKFGLPRQAGLATSLRGTVTLIPPYNSVDALRGLDGFDYLWLIWGFDRNPVSDASLTVRPPRLGGNRRMGVFATRSPFRPNGLGLSCVRLVGIDGCTLTVEGADLADATPVYDIKPYVAYADAHTDVRCGFVDEEQWHSLEVVWEGGARKTLEDRGFTSQDVEALEQILSQDPRPAYRSDGDRIYGLVFKGTDIHFRVEDGVLTVIDC